MVAEKKWTLNVGALKHRPSQTIDESKILAISAYSMKSIGFTSNLRGGCARKKKSRIINVKRGII